LVVFAGATFVVEVEGVVEAALFVLEAVVRGRVVLGAVVAALGAVLVLLRGVEVAFDVFDTVSCAGFSTAGLS
jgi:hypothetical protein